GPIGAASFNNEFGRANLAGYFRAFEMEEDGIVRGYHKPIMIAGGLGNISAAHARKDAVAPGALLVHLGGPGMLIGMGGGAASSVDTGANPENLDFDSVQRGNAEMQRRAQEVIDRCWGLGERNPVLSIHDVGAGGLSNALPELVHIAGRGATIDLRALPNEEPGMTPRELWCNEAQERFVLAVAARGPGAGRGVPAGAAASHRRAEDFSGEHWRPDGGRPVRARPFRRPVASAGRRLRGDPDGFQGDQRRSVRDGGALAARAHKSGSLWPHGGGRGSHES